MRPDKGRGTVVLDKSDYIDKMNDILNDDAKFQIVGQPNFSTIFKIEDKINRFLKHLKDSSIITDNVYSDLYATGTSFGVLYGLPKIHKQNLPLRPILAAYNTPNYKIAKYLCNILTPFSTNKYTLTNSVSLVPEILPQDSDLFMVSLDVTSLFTNVPLDFTINIILDKIF